MMNISREVWNLMLSISSNSCRTERKGRGLGSKSSFHKKSTNKSKPRMMTNQELVNMRSPVSGIYSIIKRDYILMES